MYNETKANPLDQLRKLQENIVDKLQVLGDLNVEYRNKQQKQFLKIFLHVMDKMSNQLSAAEKQYQNIDREIEKDQKCVELSTKLLFFKNQCYYLKQQLQKTEQQIKSERNKQKQILKQKQLLQSNLFQKAKQIYKYKVRAKSQQRQAKLSQLAEQQPRRICKQELEKNSGSKKYSISETKNTNLSYFGNKEEVQEDHGRNLTSSEADFRIKAAKMAKERKLVINKTYYGYSKQKISKTKPEGLQILS